MSNGKEKDKESTKQQRRGSVPRSRPMQQPKRQGTGEKPMPSKTATYEAAKKKPDLSGEKPSAYAVTQQQQEQLKRLQSRMNTKQAIEQMGELDANNHTALPFGKLKQNNASERNQNLKKQMKKRITGNGLVGGIIMSEVLGSPRAMKPYRSVVARRQQKQ
ncbi:hypothetical protein P5G51_009095 [Virgibacillus sp. 179-BFC.A HS]|uniref:Uncharacterized protein n=1 Tax=Tigheibacillus jepli TaxID=3035914 RepID=A0ABU5CJ28_9BACI|nr:hypothetical protein [Virgibacillus sp. 179-BFC.A HS]MDY0405533.1 hypothetical protein [Virgibacillus sp. 179-BFC.A HS]